MDGTDHQLPLLEVPRSRGLTDPRRARKPRRLRVRVADLGDDDWVRGDIAGQILNPVDPLNHRQVFRLSEEGHFRFRMLLPGRREYLVGSIREFLLRIGTMPDYWKTRRPGRKPGRSM